MWIANFFIAAGATMIIPFISLYIESLGPYPDAFVQKWSGYVFGITFLTAFLFAPFWGRVGDRFGRKTVLVICGIGIALSIYLMGLVDNVYQLFWLRFFMGIVTGFIPMSIALIATQTPKEKAGEVLGTLQTGAISGSLIGPVLGGVIADAVGFTYTFYLTAAIIFLSTIFVLVFVREQAIVRKSNEKKSSAKAVFKTVFTHPVLITVMMVTIMIQIANFSIQPLLALYVSEITTAQSIAFLAGLAFSATGLGNLVAARRWGKIGDKIGYVKVLIWVMVLAALIYLPQAFVTNIWQLVILRFLLGIQIGAMLPSIHALIRQVTPMSIQGEVFGYKTSFQFLGNVLGPLLGGTMAALWGIPSVFYMTSVLLLLAALITYLMTRRYDELSVSGQSEHPSQKENSTTDAP